MLAKLGRMHDGRYNKSDKCYNVLDKLDKNKYVTRKNLHITLNKKKQELYSGKQLQASARKIFFVFFIEYN